MEKVKIPEQEIINAVCVYMADKHYVYPENVMVELIYEEEAGFSADVAINGKPQVLLSEVKLIEALRHWLESEHDIDPFSVGLKFEVDDHEGIIAYMS